MRIVSNIYITKLMFTHQLLVVDKYFHACYMQVHLGNFDSSVDHVVYTDKIFQITRLSIVVVQFIIL